MKDVVYIGYSAFIPIFIKRIALKNNLLYHMKMEKT